MIARPLLLAAALLAAAPASAQSRDDVIAAPVLRANVTVTSDLVRIGDVIDNAGSAAQIAIYRAPDLGTTGTLPVAQLISALRAHQVIGVDKRTSRDFGDAARPHASTTATSRQAIARALERRNGLGEAANIALTFDRDPGDIRLDAAHSAASRARSPCAMSRATTALTSRFEISNEAGTAPAKLRFTGTAIETVEAAVLARGVERNEIIKTVRHPDRAPPESRSRQRCGRSRPRARHAGAPAASRRPGHKSPISPSPIWCSATRPSR